MSKQDISAAEAAVAATTKKKMKLFISPVAASAAIP